MQAITNLCNFSVEGQINAEICPDFYGATLIALRKSGGGIRPIAVGNTFRRLTAKLACLTVKENISQYFHPYQLGFGTPRGCEAIIHSVRTFLQLNEMSNKILLKLDFKNAFNTVERDSMLQAIREQTPKMYAFMWQAYRYPSNLYYGSDVILSQTGVQQGDPAGPLLFSLVLHSVIMNMKSQLNLYYLDDGTLGDHPHTVLNDLQILIMACRTIGLEINPDKCEIYFCSERDDAVVSAFQNIAPGIRVATKSTLTLLGSPLMMDAVAVTADQKLMELKRLYAGLLGINSHVAYFLLKNCLLIPKLNYFLRTTPLWLFPSFLSLADELTKNCLESLLNLRLEDNSWTLACLPIKFGGLGIRKLSDICVPAFLASAYGVSDFIKSIFSNYGDGISISYLSEAVEHWNVITDHLNPPTIVASQRNWDILNSRRILDSLSSSYTSDIDQARLLALQVKESGSWLKAIPSANIGTYMDDISFKIAIGLRLGCKICQSHTCICGATVDVYGRHALSCSKSAGRLSRHYSLNDIIKRAFASIDTPSILEPSGISRSDGKRPDGLTLVPWSKGKSLLWDATCTDTLATSHLPKTSKLAGSAAESAVCLKRNKYRHISDNYIFIAFAVETMGAWCQEAISLINDIGAKLKISTGDIRSTEFLRQRIGIAIQRGNAASVMGTFNNSSSLDEIFYFLSH